MFSIHNIPKWTHRFHNLKLQNKIIIATIFCVTFSTVFLGYFALKLSTGIIERNAYKQTNETIQSSAKYLDEKIKSLLININYMVINENFKEAVIKVVVDENFNQGVEFSKIEPVISQVRVTSPLIDSVYVVTPRIIFYDTTKLPITRDEILNTPIYKRFLKNKLIIWGHPGEATWLKEKEGMIPVFISINLGPEKAPSIQPADVFMMVHLKEYNIIQDLSEFRNRFAAESYLLGRDGEIISHSPEAKYLNILQEQKVIRNMAQKDSRYFYYVVNKGKVLVNFATLSVNGWKLVTVTPVEQLLGEVQYIQWVTLIVGGLCTVFLIYISIIVAKMVTKPLYKLQTVMGRVQNRDFSTRFEPKYDDEVGELANNFNVMLDEINLLIRQLKDEQEKFKIEQKLKQVAELNALQSQINPHFLYNTLDSIYWKALTGGNEQVAEMVISLAEFFRLGLNKGKEGIFIEQEVKHVERYLFLQKNIYEGKFTYEIVVEPEVYHCMILKFVLQPLAENALIHGFSEMKQGGKIQIIAKKAGRQICLEVIDNGKGFEVGKIQQALLEEKPSQSGYALTNIHRRLKLHYGDDYRMEMSSEAYRQTSIRIWIPALEEI